MLFYFSFADCLVWVIAFHMSWLLIDMQMSQNHFICENSWHFPCYFTKTVVIAMQKKEMKFPLQFKKKIWKGKKQKYWEETENVRKKNCNDGSTVLHEEDTISISKVRKIVMEKKFQERIAQSLLPIWGKTGMSQVQHAFKWGLF